MSVLSIFTTSPFGVSLHWGGRMNVQLLLSIYLQRKDFHFWGTKQQSHKGKVFFCVCMWISHFPSRIYWMSGEIVTVWSFLFLAGILAGKQFCDQFKKKKKSTPVLQNHQINHSARLFEQPSFELPSFRTDMFHRLIKCFIHSLLAQFFL